MIENFTFFKSMLLKKHALYLLLMVLCYNSLEAYVWNTPYDIGTSQWEYAKSVARDFDNDGDIDIIVTGLRLAAGTYTARIYVNDGTGTFTENNITNVSTIGNFRINHLASADFNGDNKPDLLLSYSGSTEVFLNDGNGTSFTRNHQWAGVSAIAIDLGDIDGDTDIDFVLIDWGAPDIKKYVNNGSGTFTPTSVEVLGDDAAPVDGGNIGVTYGSVKLFDVDGDNDLDFVSVYTDSGGEIEAALQVFTNNGSGVFTQKSITIDNNNSNFKCEYGPLIMPVNLDLDTDVDFFLTSHNVTISFTNDGTGVFSTTNNTLYSGLGGASSIIEDIDGDSDIDVLFWHWNYFYKAINDGSNNYTFSSVANYAPINGQPIAGKSIWPKFGDVTFADFDGDATPDLHVFTNQSTAGGDYGGLYGSLCPSTVSITTSIKISDTEYSFTADPDDNGCTAITEKGIVWSTSPNPTITDYSGIATAPAGGNDEYTLNATNLQIGPGYYVRAYATNSTGTSYSEQVHFGVVPTLPEWGLIILSGGFVLFGGWFAFKRLM